MSNFLLRQVEYNNIQEELASIEFDSSYRNKITEKFRHKNIKIYNLSLAQANILKQTALIFGADCAINRNVITGNIEKSDVILCGSYSQLLKVAEKLKSQPFKLAILAKEIEDFLKPSLRKTKIVGILNVTPDSFSDGGLYNEPQIAIKKLVELFEDGADMVDIGAESTRPNSVAVNSEEQIKRLKPVLEFIQKEFIGKLPVSVDTRSSDVADFALNLGVNIINDVSGAEYDPKILNVVSKYNAGIILQHSKGTPNSEPVYTNLIDEIFSGLKNKVDYAKEAGINNIIIDPGIGFGKSRLDNLKILDSIDDFYGLICPVMIGISRKRILGIPTSEISLKDALTLAYSYPLIEKKVDFLRVHNVKMHKTFINSLPT